MIKLTLQSNSFSFNYGEVILKDIHALELVQAIDSNDTALQEVIAMIALHKGNDWLKEATNEAIGE